MSQTIQAIIQALENTAPLSYQESYDNSGLLVGDRNKKINKVLLTLDCTEAVIDEAIAQKCQLIIAHHPILFSGIKSLTGKNYIERVLLKAIKKDIAIYASHTNLDNIQYGVNNKIAEKIGLENVSILAPMQHTLKQLYVYVPLEYANNVKQAMFEAGAGNIGNYSDCSFAIEGAGTFKPIEGANPFVGKKNELQTEKEVKIEVLIPIHKENAILQAMKKTHPYEEVAYGIINLSNYNQTLGAGMIGELSAPISELQFLKKIKQNMQTKCIRHTPLLGKMIKKVAICGGSGSFLLSNAIQAGADAFITGDFKYHQFFDAEQKLIIADIGHYESEQFTPEIFYDILSKKFPNFAIQISSVNTNPVSYY